MRNDSRAAQRHGDFDAAGTDTNQGADIGRGAGLSLCEIRVQHPLVWWAHAKRKSVAPQFMRVANATPKRERLQRLPVATADAGWVIPLR